jgi:hypothetical protein
VKTGLKTLIRGLVSPLLSFVAGKVTEIFFCLNVVDAVALWVVQVLSVDGESQIGALAFFASPSDVEAGVLTELLGLEVGWVVVALFDFKFVLTAQVRAIDIIRLISCLVDKAAWARDSSLLPCSHLLDCDLPALADLVMSDLECCWCIIDSQFLDGWFASLLRECLPLDDSPLVHLAERAFLGHSLFKVD